jgi:fructokinase
VNLRQHFHSPDLVEECLKRSDIVKINDEELRAVMGMLGCAGGEGKCCAEIVDRFGLRCLCVTRGAGGSEVHLPGGGRTVQGPVDADRQAAPLMDTVGAGDAYTAMLCAGYLRGLPWERTIAAASRFAAALCTVRGALPDGDDFYLPFKDELEGAHR